MGAQDAARSYRAEPSRGRKNPTKPCSPYRNFKLHPDDRFSWAAGQSTYYCRTHASKAIGSVPAYYYHALKQGYKTNLENEIPIYNQILQQEQIELHKLIMIVKNNNGTVLDVNTDAVSCIFEGAELHFELEGINLKGFYYDTEKLIPKYKIIH